jgi:hypothetical protein
LAPNPSGCRTGIRAEPAAQIVEAEYHLFGSRQDRKVLGELLTLGQPAAWVCPNSSSATSIESDRMATAA